LDLIAFGTMDLREHRDRWLKQRTFGFCKCHWLWFLFDRASSIR